MKNIIEDINLTDMSNPYLVSLIAILIAKITSSIESVQYVALIIILINGFLGYFWGNYIYSAPFKKNPNKKKLFFFNT